MSNIVEDAGTGVAKGEGLAEVTLSHLLVGRAVDADPEGGAPLVRGECFAAPKAILSSTEGPEWV